MVTLEFPFAYDDYINPHFRPLASFVQNSFGEQEKRVRVRVWANCVRVERIVNKFEIFHFHRNFVKCVEEWNTWQSNKNQHSYTIWTLNGKFTSNSQLLQSKTLLHWLFTETVKNLFFLSNTHLNQIGLISLYSRREIISYELKLIFWVYI